MGQSSSVNPSNVHLSGYCDHQYIPVRTHLKNQLLKGEEKNVQLCVYVNGKCVIDLYGTSTGDLDFNRDKLQVQIAFWNWRQKILANPFYLLKWILSFRAKSRRNWRSLNFAFREKFWIANIRAKTLQNYYFVLEFQEKVEFRIFALKLKECK